MNVPPLDVVLSTVYSILLMIRVLGTVFAALMGLAFGSFLNVCLTRWPAGESIVKPRSHCRNCSRTLAWWENVPLVSWLALRGRCRTCGTWIGWRYPLVEFSVGFLWAKAGWDFARMLPYYEDWRLMPFGHWKVHDGLIWTAGQLIFYWILVAIAALDAENFWIPDRLTFPGIALGIALSAYYVSDWYYLNAGRIYSSTALPPPDPGYLTLGTALPPIIDTLLAATLILLIRWIYKLIRHREGLGLGDAKLMAMLAAWLGLPGALLSFAIGVVLGSVVAIVVLVGRKSHEGSESWAGMKLPLGTFLCIGGIVSSLWGQPIIAAYMRWAGF
jgi:leader peptidase (prepilin peptidase) / N-methyltransferase